MTVGLREVERKRAEWRGQRDDAGKYLGRHMIPVVLGPKGKSYVIDHHHLARALVEEFAEATTSAAARELLRHALAAAEGDDGYTALKIARRVMRHEDEVLGLVPASPCRWPPSEAMRVG